MVITLGVVLCFSCRKEPALVQTGSLDGAITFGVDASFTAEVKTKTVEVTSMSSFYVSAVTGSVGSESSVWNSVTFSQVPASTPVIYAGNKFWPATDPGYKFLASNLPLIASVSGAYVNATNETDVVCAYLPDPTYNGNNTLSFNHIFARTGIINTTCAHGSLSNVSYTIKAKGTNTGTSGKYNLRTGVWSSTSGLSSAMIITSSSNMYIIPGQYTIAVTATYTRGDYVVTKTLSGDLTFIQGKVNNLNITWPDGGTEIVVSISLTAWSSQNIFGTLSPSAL